MIPRRLRRFTHGDGSFRGRRSFEELAILPNGTVNEAYRPLAISQYHVHVHRWLEVFPREQLLVVNGDQLIDDPVSQLRRIEDFLGIEPRIGSNNFYFNETKGFYCLRNETGDKCLRETKGRKHPRVDPVVISKLRKFFVEHNQKFYELVGEDLGWPEE
uniref:Sulfotransferase domain-containing protein n=1 Tax=Anopheles stephensi TaxID=30069 RepID=A0A182YKU9_ANOST